MKVIICGAGQVGWQIARHLSGERNDVTVVDSNPDLVRRATETLDVRGVTGFASYPDVLEKAGARDADMIIAATYSDEVNMVTCQVAHSVFGITRKIARLRAQNYLIPAYGDLYRRDHLPIDVVISPEREVARAALQRLSAPSTFDAETFLTGKLHLLGIVHDVGNAWVASYLPRGYEKRALEEMKTQLGAFVARELPGVTNVVTHVGHGHVAETVVAMAEKVHADLIVLAANAPDELRTFRISASADRVVRHSPVSVSIVR